MGSQTWSSSRYSFGGLEGEGASVFGGLNPRYPSDALAAVRSKARESILSKKEIDPCRALNLVMCVGEHDPFCRTGRMSLYG